MSTGKKLSTSIDASVPTAARMYDHYLGGKDNDTRPTAPPARNSTRSSPAPAGSP